MVAATRASLRTESPTDRARSTTQTASSTTRASSRMESPTDRVSSTSRYLTGAVFGTRESSRKASATDKARSTTTASSSTRASSRTVRLYGSDQRRADRFSCPPLFFAMIRLNQTRGCQSTFAPRAIQRVTRTTSYQYIRMSG